MKKFNKKIILEDGEEYLGYGFGANKEAIFEIVFNTSMVGYQEIVSDPSYTYQMVVMTYPLIGNYGITDDDYETNKPTIGGLIVREYNDNPSNFRYTKTLSEYLEENNIPGIYGLDTRKLTRSIRDKGSRKVIITDINTSKEEALEKIRKYEIPKDAVSKVSCKKTWYSRTANPKYNIVAVDCGIKLNIIRSLNKRGGNVTVVPYNTPYEKIVELKPDGIFLSNGPRGSRKCNRSNTIGKRNKRKISYIWNMLRTSINKLSIWGKNLQVKIWTQGRKSSCIKFRNRKNRNYKPKPQLCSR